MKYQQGLLLESTRVSFSLSHQCSVNGAVRSWCCLSALQGVGRVCRRKGALLGEHNSRGLSVAPCDQGEPEHRGQELQHICEKHCCQCSLGRTKIFMHHHSDPVCLTQAARGSRRAASAAAVADTHCASDAALGNLCGSWFLSEGCFHPLALQLGLPE